jgi:hypothetical protein
MTIEFQVQPSKEEIAEGLRVLRRWHRRSWLAMATYLPVAGTLSALLHRATNSDWLTALPPVAWLLMFGFSTAYANTLPCPRCGKPFRPMNGMQIPWDTQCASCGLSLSPPT